MKNYATLLPELSPYKGEIQREPKINMKTSFFIIVICNLMICNLQFSQTYSDITYDAGTLVEVQTAADVCATNIYINGTFSGGGTICTGALPVSLSSFTYSADKRNVTLMWVTEWELNNSGFEIERAGVTPGGVGGWSKAGFIAGHGTINTSSGYMFKDEKLNTGLYKYRLKQIDYNSNYEYFELNTEVSINPPKNFDMGQNYPNPGNPKCKINFEMPVDGRVSVKVYDILGKEVMTLIDENRKADYYTIEFDGSNIATGVYFYRIYAEGEGQKFTKTLKMILVK